MRRVLIGCVSVGALLLAGEAAAQTAPEASSRAGSDPVASPSTNGPISGQNGPGKAPSENPSESSVKANVSAGPASSTPSSPAPPAASSNGQIQDVVVTAERRSTNLQTSSLTADALTGAELKRDNVDNVLGLQRLAPALSVTDTGLQRFINIRGIGASASLPGVQNGVVYNVDGVFTRSTLTEVPYYDIARVEILRGPQGTLSSQNAEAGALNVVTASPVIGGGYTGYAELGYANYSHFNGEAAVNLPVSDTLAARVAVFGETRDSYFRNVASSIYRPGDLHRLGGRFELIWQPTSNFSAQFRYEHYDRTSDGFAYKPVPGDPSNTFNGVVSYKVAPSDPFTLAFDAPTRGSLRIDRENLELKWDVLSWLQIRSLTAYLEAPYSSIQDQDGNAQTPALGVGTANVRPFITTQTFTARYFSQEVNLITKGAGPLQGVLGAYYYHNDGPATIQNAQISANNPKNLVKGIAVFGQATYDVTDRIRLTAGVRQNHDEGSTDGTTTIRALNRALPGDSSYKSNATTWKAAVDVKLSPEQFLYGVISRGYRSGGTNVAPAPTFAPEHLTNYELGLKSTLFDRHLRTQLDGFYDHYTGFQVNIFDPTLAAQVIENGPDATLYGLEFQAQAQFGQFSADGSFAYLHTRFDNRNGNPFLASDTRYAAGTPGFTPIEITGKSIPFAQKYTGYVGVQYDIPVGGDKLIPRVQFSYNGNQYATIFQQPYDLIPQRHTIDLRLTYVVGKYQLAGYVTNVENNTYVNGKFAGFQYYGAPREYGFKLDFRF